MAQYSLAVMRSQKAGTHICREEKFANENIVYIQTHSLAVAHDIVTAKTAFIKSLSNKRVAHTSILSINNYSAGSAAFVLSPKAIVCLHIKGRVDIDC
jgi:hypothetical protein